MQDTLRVFNFVFFSLILFMCIKFVSSDGLKLSEIICIVVVAAFLHEFLVDIDLFRATAESGSSEEADGGANQSLCKKQKGEQGRSAIDRSKEEIKNERSLLSKIIFFAQLIPSKETQKNVAKQIGKIKEEKNFWGGKVEPMTPKFEKDFRVTETGDSIYGINK